MDGFKRPKFAQWDPFERIWSIINILRIVQIRKENLAWFGNISEELLMGSVFVRFHIWLGIYIYIYIYIFFFLNSRKSHFPESVFCGSKWASKIPVVPGSYKRCTPWFELETCYADLKPFAITPRYLGTLKLYIINIYSEFY